MNFTEKFENIKNVTVDAANTAVDKAKQLAAIAKANIAIYGEEDKVRKAEQQLGKLYYRDYAVGEEMDGAEYLPWCQKIDESKQLIAQLRDQIEDLKAQTEAPAAQDDSADFVIVDESAAEEAPAEELPAAEAEVVIDIPDNKE